MELFTTLRKISSRKEDFKKWELDEEKNDKKREMYYQKRHFTPQELENAKQLGQRLVDTISIMDEKSEDVAENVETATQIGVGIFSAMGEFAGLGIGLLINSKNIKNSIFSFIESGEKNVGLLKNKLIKSGVSIIGLSLIGTIAASVSGQIYATKLQIEGSRVGRHQARNELDNKDFVLYNEQQIAKAKEIAKTMPETKDKNFLGDVKSIASMLNPIGFFKELKDVIKKHETTLQERKKLNNTNVNVNLTSQEAAEAEKQQKLLNNIIKKINNKAEEYSENMETTSGVVVGSSFLLGGVLGNVANKITDKVIKVIDPMGMYSKNPIMQKVARTMVGGLLVTMATVPILLKLQKNAARAGRFEAKKELLQDPRNFIAIDEKEMKDIPDPNIKPKSLFSRMINVFAVIPQSIKSAIAYDKYKNTELKELKKLSQAFKQIEVIPEQLNKGQKLKERVFKSFEKIDDYSQAFSEKAEVVCEIGQSSLGLASSVLIYAPFIAILYDKPSIATIIKKASSIMSKGMDTNWFKKYAAKVQKNVVNIIDNQKIKLGIQAHIEENKKISAKFLDNEFLNIGKLNLSKLFDKNLFISDLRNKVSSFPTEEAFREFAQENFLFKKLYNKKLTRKDAVEILDNAKKILDNKEGKALIKVIYDKLQESPEKTLSLLFYNPGKLLDGLDIKKYMIIAGGSYAAINIAGISAISAYLADLQKKAGRLGVMEALEEINKETQNQLTSLSIPNTPDRTSFSSMQDFLSKARA